MALTSDFNTTDDGAFTLNTCGSFNHIDYSLSSKLGNCT